MGEKLSFGTFPFALCVADFWSSSTHAVNGLFNFFVHNFIFQVTAKPLSTLIQDLLSLNFISPCQPHRSRGRNLPMSLCHEIRNTTW